MFFVHVCFEITFCFSDILQLNILIMHNMYIYRLVIIVCAYINEGSADAARAALAALLPNTFLQALVWHTLTAPEAELLPEVNQNEDL